MYYLRQLIIVIGTTKRLMSSRKSRVDQEIMRCRLRIKMMVLCLFALAALPWLVNLCMKYLNFSSTVSNIVFCLDCMLQVRVMGK